MADLPSGAGSVPSPPGPLSTPVERGRRLIRMWPFPKQGGDRRALRLSRVDIPTLTTPRLILRAPDPITDLDYMAAYNADAEAMRFIGDGSVQGREDARVALEGFVAEWDRWGHGRWTVALRSTGVPIGNCGFVRWREGEEDERPELASGFVREAWGRGYATEAARAALRWAFTTLPFDQVVALTHPANVASQRVLAKLGFAAVGEVVPSHGRRMAMFVLPRPITQSRS